ncbi:MAG: homoserine O-succinyltransferase [Candidatus Binataceae bacterium]|nr:homoserine O-succinyltransferase [Candidatus Binataceae bacterium]
MITLSSGTSSGECDHNKTVAIGLVNNMPDTALTTTEQQFRRLLSAAAAAQERAVSLRVFYLADVPRGAEAREYIRGRYTDVGELWEGSLDGLIVTGAEPQTAALSDEPYWPLLAKLVEWADGHTISTVWSCLAAHAAVLHSDGIDRRRLDEKLFGLFECARCADDPLLAGAPSSWKVPHSRYHDLSEDGLAAKGYKIISRSDAVGADMFVKRKNSLFVFLQGHPEYDDGALLREYRRDVRRFLSGQSDCCPKIPCGYFDGMTAAMRKVQGRGRDQYLFDDFALAHKPTVDTRCPLGGQLYSNWLSYVVEQKGLDRGPNGPNRQSFPNR